MTYFDEEYIKLLKQIAKSKEIWYSNLEIN